MDNAKRKTMLVCDGFRAGASAIPSFHVGPGEIVKIVFPPECARDMHLAEQLICKEFNRLHRALPVELADQPGWWRELWHSQTTSEWLIEHCGLSRAEAVERLTILDVEPDRALNCLACNPRWMLGFVAAMHRVPDVLVFTTSGCDPLGCQRALAAVQSQLNDAAGVYLTCFPGLRMDEPRYTAVMQAASIKQMVA